MTRMPLNVIVGSVRPAKEDGKFYVEFMFLGGHVSVLVDKAQAERLKTASASGFVAVFDMKPRSVVLFDRSVTVFEPIALLDLPSSERTTLAEQLKQQGK